MSLREFQRAMSDLIASPGLCLRLREEPERVLATYTLTAREQRRLTTVVSQRGMSVNCSLYRVNRVTPIYTLLPLTCRLLGDAMRAEMEAFWSDYRETDLLYRGEVQRFGEFLRGRLERERGANQLLADVLEFELALNELRFLPRRRLLDEVEKGAPVGGGRLRAHPLVRALAFRSDPALLLEALGHQDYPADSRRRGDTYLLLDGRRAELEFAVVQLQVARWLLRPDEARAGTPEVDALISEGLLISFKGEIAPEAAADYASQRSPH
jgi:hypothetical protein